MDWDTIRDERGLIQHICPEHRNPHPNIAAAVRLAARLLPIAVDELGNSLVDNDVIEEYDLWRDLGDLPRDSELWPLFRGMMDIYLDHECCGCCGDADFPGNVENTIRHCIDKYSLPTLAKLTAHYPYFGYALFAGKIINEPPHLDLQEPNLIF